MNKNTKMLIGLSLVAAGGYLYLKSKKPTATATKAYDATLVRAVGRRQNFTNSLTPKESKFNFADNFLVKESGWR